MDNLTIAPPEGFEISEVKIINGIATAFLKEKEKEKKDLQYYWREYLKSSGYLRNDASIYNVHWHWLIDFYHLFAEELNEGWKGSYKRPEYAINYKIPYGFMCGSGSANYEFGICFKDKATTELAISILGEDLLKKIFQVK